MQALAPLAAAAPAVPPDVCALAGTAPMPDPKSPACRLHCAVGVAGAGQAALDAPAARSIVVHRPALRLAVREEALPRACGEIFDSAARAPPAFS